MHMNTDMCALDTRTFVNMNLLIANRLQEELLGIGVGAVPTVRDTTGDLVRWLCDE